MLLAVIALLWIFRSSIVTNIVDRTLTERGVEATYRLERIGLNHQRLTAVRIGDARRPDLTAEQIDIWIGLSWQGPAVRQVTASGVRVRGRLQDDQLTLGQLDRLLPARTNEPFTFPDIAIALHDAAAIIDTPWGRVAAGVEGRGNLAVDYTGELALLAPSVRGFGCAGQGLRFVGRTRTTSGAPTVTGVLRAAAGNCATNDLAVTGARIPLRIVTDARFQDIAFAVTPSASRVAGAGASATTLIGRIRGNWRIAEQQMSSHVSLTVADLGVAGGRARRAAVQSRLSYDRGVLDAEGGFALAGARDDGAIQAIAGAARDAAEQPVIGPLAAAFATAVERARTDMRLRLPFRLRRDRAGRTQFVAHRIDASSTSGLRVALEGASPPLLVERGAARLAGTLTVAGGGLPDISVALRGGSGRPWEGRLTMAPWQSDGAALAFTPVDFRWNGRDVSRFATRLQVSGPVGNGGRLDSATMVLRGGLSPSGRLTLDGGCQVISWRALGVAGAQFGPSATRLCSAPGRSLLAVARGEFVGDLRVPQLRLNGRLGSASFALAATNASWRLDSGSGALDGARFAIGGDNGVRMTAERLVVDPSAAGWGGALNGATARIGAVPLAMDEISGRWRFAGGRLTVDGAMRVSDAIAPARFTPLVVPDASVTLAGNRLAATGTLTLPDPRAQLARVTIGHALTTGAGQADVAVIPLRFTPDGLQPANLTDLMLGVAANVDGTVTGVGRINWTADAVTSSGNFTTDTMDLAAAFGPVQRLSGTINFDNLLTLSTPPGQRVLLGSVNPGIEVVDGELRYQMLSTRQLRIEGGQWPFAGGTLRLHPGLIDLAADQPRYLTFDVEGIDAARFLQRYGFENISATGIFDGVLPTVFDQNGGRVVNGGLVVRDGGGTLAYVGELTNRDLGYFANLAFGALRSVRYDALVVRLNGNIDGEMLTEVSFTGLGQGPGATNNFLTRQIARLPFAFDIRINAPFRQLLTSARSFYDPTILIDQNLPALIRAEAEARAARRPQAPPDTVQEQESGDDP